MPASATPGDLPSAAPPPPPPSPPRGFLARTARFFHAHPLLALAVLTPGIPEYLSTSSPILNLAVNPLWFFLGLAINVGQYTAGALLIREAMIRWRKGWASVAVLAVAYAIVEEGLGDATLYNSNDGRDGVLGQYGRYAGVNWVWSTSVVVFHLLFSIALPLLLLNLALPETKGRSLLARRGLLIALGTLAASTVVEAILVRSLFQFFLGVPLLVGSLAAVAALVALAYALPADAAVPASRRPVWSGRELSVVAFGVFPVILAVEGLAPAWHLPAGAAVAMELAFLVGVFLLVRAHLGREGNEPQLVALATGLLVWQTVFGLLITITLPVNLLLVPFVVLFLRRLRAAHPEAPAGAPPAPVPPGALSGR